jgi:hypothetical protein
MWLGSDESEVSSSENWEEEPVVFEDIFGAAAKFVSFSFVCPMVRELIYRLIVKEFDGAL